MTPFEVERHDDMALHYGYSFRDPDGDLIRGPFQA
jgi:hypothetical protein